MKASALAFLVALLMSCGPSSAVVKTARETHYKGPPATLFATAKTVVTEADYPIALADENGFTLKTEGRWYTPEGQVDRTRGNNIARLQENSVNFSVRVTVIKMGGESFTVTVEPVALKLRGLSSEPDPLKVGDPEMPGWVMSKVDTLQMSIYDRLKSYAVTGGTTPATPTAAAPAAPTGSAPAPAPAPTGSATEPVPAPAPTP
jgi:hypothetical protein